MDTNQPNNQEQQTPGYSNQPPAGGAPYQPPQQQQYQQQPYGYQQAPPPPPQQKKGFNWLACCGITCLVLVIIGGAMAFCTYKMAAPFTGLITKMQNIQTEVRATDASVMRAGAVAVDTQMLATNAASYEGSWLELTGELSVEDGANSFSSEGFGGEQTTSYLLLDHVMLMDVSNGAKIGNPGDTVRAYGKAFAWDLMELEKMPFFGEYIADEMRSDPEISGNSKVVFFICKGVELVETGSGGAASSEGGNEDTGGDGWVR